MKSQIAKDFDMKSRLRKFADGGAIKEVINRRSRLEQAEAAAMGEAPPPPPAPPPTQSTTPPPKKGLIRRMLGLRDGGDRLGEEYAKTKYQQSGLRDGGHVRGKGGPTDDEIGPVMLSDEEYVLPADTVDAIGKEKLDAIRLATHKFKDPRKKEGLRDMVDGDDVTELADGGGVWEAAKAKLRNIGVQTPTPAGAAGVVPEASGASRVGAGLKAGVSLLQRAANPLFGAGFGFGDYKADTGGVDTSAPGTLGYARKGELENIKTSLSGGAAEVLADSGRGYAKSIDGITGLFGLSPNLTGKYDNMLSNKSGGYLSLREPSGAVGNPAGTEAPYSNEGRQESRPAGVARPAGPLVGNAGNERGREVLRNEGTSAFQELGNYGGNTAIFGRGSGKDPRRMNDFQGFGAPTAGGGQESSAVQNELRAALRNIGTQDARAESNNPGFSGTLGSENDRRLDRREAEIRATYGSSLGKGNMTKHLAELDRQRQNVEQAAVQNETARRGQDLNATSSANATNASARSNLFQTLSQNENSLRNAADSSNARALDFAKNAAKLQYEAGKDAKEFAARTEKDQLAQIEKGSSDLELAAEKRYGKDSDDAKKFTSFLASAPKELIGQLAALPADQRGQGFEDMFARYEQNKIMNNRQENNLWGGITSQEYDPVAEQRPVKFFEDVFNRGLPLRDGVQSKLRGLAGGDDKVLVTDSGRAVQQSEIPDDIRNMRIIRDQLADAPRRSKLRDKDKK